MRYRSSRSSRAMTSAAMVLPVPDWPGEQRGDAAAPGDALGEAPVPQTVARPRTWSAIWCSRVRLGFGQDEIVPGGPAPAAWRAPQAAAGCGLAGLPQRPVPPPRRPGVAGRLPDGGLVEVELGRQASADGRPALRPARRGRRVPQPTVPPVRPGGPPGIDQAVGPARHEPAARGSRPGPRRSGPAARRAGRRPPRPARAASTYSASGSSIVSRCHSRMSVG